MSAATTYDIPDSGSFNERSVSAVPLYRISREIKRSRFIVSAAHADNRDSALAFISDITTEFRDATHNCWAYAAGAPGDTGLIGMSDDGEPHGTAGKPILNALLYGGVGECVIVVTRYFGGIKLGTGGLVRAYGGSAAEAIESMPVTAKRTFCRLSVIIDFAHMDRFHRLLPKFGARSIRQTFASDASYLIEMPEDAKDGFIEALYTATDGAAIAESLSMDT